MLGKIGWRLVADPDAFVCRVLKAKYFPEGNFLNAIVGHNPSYTWRSICSSQDLLLSGIRWRIGGGERVKVYQDPWLRRDGSFYITSVRNPEMDNLSVNDLMIPGTRLWDVELVTSLFDENEARDILSIPLSPSSMSDKLIWHYTRNGDYSVKTAYKLACSMTIDGAYAVQGDWKALWKIKVPPKVKNFMWRAAHNVLPTKTNLGSKGIQVASNCGVCGSGYENAWHSFVTCSFAKECWKAANLEQVVGRGIEVCDSFRELIFFIIKHNTEEVKALWCMMLYQIWKDRNAATWNNHFPTPQQSRHLAYMNRSDWLVAQHGGKINSNSADRSNSPTCLGWHNLQEGWYRCSVDAAFFASENATGIGIILRDALGVFVAAKVKWFPGCMRVEEGEAMGLHEALSWIKHRSMAHVEFETDSKIVFDAIRSRLMDDSELGAITRSCKNILALNPGFKVKHIRRDANVVAHELARMSINFSTPRVWEEPPDVVEGLLHFPCVCD